MADGLPKRILKVYLYSVLSELLTFRVNYTTTTTFCSGIYISVKYLQQQRNI